MAHRMTVPRKTPRSVAGRLMYLSLLLAVVTAVVLGMGRLMSAPGWLLFTAKLVFVVAAPGTLFLSLARHLLGEARTLEWVKNLTLLFVTLAVTSVLAEFGMRVLFAGITTTGDNRSYWARKWNATHVHLNHLGYREREFPAQKPRGVYRIAVVGDSFTFGQGIEEGDRFTNRIDHTITHGGQPFEVLNFGRPGAETIDEVQMLKDAVLSTQPDFVLLVWYSNDVEGHDKSGLPKALPLVPSDTLEHLLLRNSALYFVLKSGWDNLQERLDWTAHFDDYMLKRFGNPASADSREAAAMLAEFVALCREQNIAVGIVLFPRMEGIGRYFYKYDYLHQRVLTFCTQEGLTCLDLREPMEQVGQHARLIVNRFDFHPSAEANRIAAEEILKRFGPIWDQAAIGRYGRAKRD